jgi:hypothetical protein
MVRRDCICNGLRYDAKIVKCKTIRDDSAPAVSAKMNGHMFSPVKFVIKDFSADFLSGLIL